MMVKAFRAWMRRRALHGWMRSLLNSGAAPSISISHMTIVVDAAVQKGRPDVWVNVPVDLDELVNTVSVKPVGPEITLDPRLFSDGQREIIQWHGDLKVLAKKAAP